MKQYKGKLDKEIQELINQNYDHIIGLSIANSGLNRPSSKTYSIEETVEMYNPGISIDEIKAWVWYRKQQGVPMEGWKNYFVPHSKNLIFNWVKKGVLFYDPETKNYVPYPVFVFGNIYSKITQLIRSQNFITENFGASVYEDHKEVLEKIKPEKISVSNPIASERPVILAISQEAREFKVSSLRDNTGVILESERTLIDAYRSWLFALPREDIKKTTAYNIISYYINKERQPHKMDKAEWEKIKKQTRDEGERLFSEFLNKALTFTDQIRLDISYNEKYNATAPLQYQKIPIGIEVSRNFMGNTLSVKSAQREGIAFMELVGSGIIAYDVGVGKTITAIIEAATAIKNGKCKRPLIVVPNPTYANWMKEMLGDGELEGVLTGTGITVNDWFNLGVTMKGLNLKKAIPENTITLVSYEGLEKIGFGDAVREEHFKELADIIGQADPLGDRDQEKANEKYLEIVGVGVKDTIADIEVLGIDYIVIDEAHNFKNVFSEVKSTKGQGKQFYVKGGKPSDRGIKAFFICNYIQRKYGRNVMLLTATPFTNSPMEIYSMLSLVAYQYMKENSIVNLNQFFEQYISEVSEYVVSPSGEINQKNVVKSFNNRISLQKLINSHINFKTGEEAGVPRPCKINLPKLKEVSDTGEVTTLKPKDQVLTYLKFSPEQAEMQKEINIEVHKGADRDDPGRILSLLADAQNNALSPFLVGKSKKSQIPHLNIGSPKDYLDFVRKSPKILYALKCIESVKKHHEATNTPVSGQVIYMDRGKEYFRYIKEYLEKEVGYKKAQRLTSDPKLKVDEVEVVAGGIDAKKKEKIKNAFNEGVCKIIIGTSTIKEGINLQERSTTLYNLYPNWNPTDLKQLEGRIYRQKNKYNFVRIVMPLMENSMDVFVFQKLEEKTARINDLWSKTDRGNVLDEESLDPNEVKFALVTDIMVLVRFRVKELKEEYSSDVGIYSKRVEDLDAYTNMKTNLEYYRKKLIESVSDYARSFHTKVISNVKEYVTFGNISTFDLEALPEVVQNAISKHQEAYAKLKEVEQGEHTDKDLIMAVSAYKRLGFIGYSKPSFYVFDAFKQAVSDVSKIERSLFKSRGYDENTNIELIKKELQLELETAEQRLEHLTSKEFEQELYEEIRLQKEASAIQGASLVERVEQFKSLNHLLDYKFEKTSAESCSIPTAKWKPEKTNTEDRTRRLKLARARAAAKIKLRLN